jgi:hypothetical protein
MYFYKYTYSFSVVSPLFEKAFMKSLIIIHDILTPGKKLQETFGCSSHHFLLLIEKHE